MPPLTRWLIRSGLIYLIAALATGVLAAAGNAMALPTLFAGLSPLFYQLLMIGWLTQLIFGVANWMFPIYSREQPRRSPTLGWAGYIGLNAGLLLFILVEVGGLSGAPISGWVRGVGAILLFCAGFAFVINTWQRVSGH